MTRLDRGYYCERSGERDCRRVCPPRWRLHVRQGYDLARSLMMVKCGANFPIFRPLVRHASAAPYPPSRCADGTSFNEWSSLSDFDCDSRESLPTVAGIVSRLRFDSEFLFHRVSKRNRAAEIAAAPCRRAANLSLSISCVHLSSRLAKLSSLGKVVRRLEEAFGTFMRNLKNETTMASVAEEERVAAPQLCRTNNSFRMAVQRPKRREMRESQLRSETPTEEDLLPATLRMAQTETATRRWHNLRPRRRRRRRELLETSRCCRNPRKGTT